MHALIQSVLIVIALAAAIGAFAFAYRRYKKRGG